MDFILDTNALLKLHVAACCILSILCASLVTVEAGHSESHMRCQMATAHVPVLLLHVSTAFYGVVYGKLIRLPLLMTIT